MASRKRKRKAERQAHKEKYPRTGPFRHPDGDRRRRGKYMTYEQVLALKQMLHQGELAAQSGAEEE
jgi:hypothetical protein